MPHNDLDENAKLRLMIARVILKNQGIYVNLRSPYALHNPSLYEYCRLTEEYMNGPRPTLRLMAKFRSCFLEFLLLF